MLKEINVPDSVLFLSSAREVIKEGIESSSIKDKDILANYMVNEASDYEVMSVLLREEFPKEKYDMVGEIELFSELQSIIVNNKSLLESALTKKIVQTFTELGPVSPWGLSTAKPIMEHIIATGSLQTLLEAGDTIDLSNERIFKELSKIGPAINLLRLKATKNAAKAAGDASSKISKALLAKNKEIANQIKSLTRRKSFLEKAKGLATQGSGAATSALNVIATKSGAAGVAAKIGVGQTAAGAGVAIGGLALAALLAFGAYKTYQRFFSQAAKACKDKSGAVKSQCMNAFKAKAIQAQMADLRKSMSACSKSKDPKKCSASVGGKLKKLNIKLQKIKLQAAKKGY